jgi:hypothetical protein
MTPRWRGSRGVAAGGLRWMGPTHRRESARKRPRRPTRRTGQLNHRPDLRRPPGRRRPVPTAELGRYQVSGTREILMKVPILGIGTADRTLATKATVAAGILVGPPKPGPAWRHRHEAGAGAGHDTASSRASPDGDWWHPTSLGYRRSECPASLGLESARTGLPQHAAPSAGGNHSDPFDGQGEPR